MQPSPTNKNRALTVALLLALAVLALYARTAGFSFVLTDDPTYVTENPHVLGGPTPSNLAWAFTTFEASNWHPLTWISMMLDARIGGGSARAFHVTNALLHTLATLLLFALFYKMTRALWSSAAVALLFGIHPLHVESVAWIAERKDVLSTCLGLGALLAWVRYVKRPAASSYAPAAALFAASLMAKPMLVTLPFVMLLLEYWPLERWRPGDREALKRSLVDKLPLLAISAASSWVTLAAQREVVGTLEQFPFALRLQNAIVAYAVYLRRMVWPSDLAMPYPYVVEIGALTLLAALALLAAITALVVWLRRERYLTVGWLWYLGTLVPVVGLVQIGTQPLADRYSYLPLVGPFVMLAWGVPRLLRVGDQRERRTLVAVASGLALAALALGTWRQLGHWKDSRALFERALAVTERNVLAHNGIATVLTEEGRTDEAMAHYREALRLNPAAEYARLKLSGLLVAAGRVEEAAALYEELLAAFPSSVFARINYAALLMRLGRPEQAAEEYRMVLVARPDDPSVHRGLALALEAAGRSEEAQKELEISLRQSGATPESLVALGNMLARQGDPAGAAEQYRAAIALDPSRAGSHLNLAIALMQQDRLAEARTALEEALRLDPTHAVAHKRMGVLLYREGQVAGAIREFEESLRLDPTQADLQRDLEKMREIAARETQGG